MTPYLSNFAFPSAEDDEPGMTLRDYFAAKVLTTLSADLGWSNDEAAQMCYEMADAMMKARLK